VTWETICIGDLGRVVTGDTPPKSNPAFYGNAYPFIKPTDMRVGERYTRDFEDGYSEEAFEKYRKKLIPAGSTAVVTIGSIGQKLTMIETPSFVNQAVNAVIPNLEKFDPLYVYYLLRHNLQLVKSADTGASSGRENVSKSNFSSIEVVVVKDKSVQKRIGVILGGYDDLIENNQRRITLCEKASRLLYRKWFGEVNSNISKESSSAVIGEGERIKSLYEIADLTMGYPFKSSGFNSEKLGKPAIRIRDIPEGRSNTWTLEDPCNAIYQVVKGDFLVGMDGIFHMNHWHGEPAWLVQRVCRVNPKNPMLRGYLALSLYEPIKHLEATISGATVAHLGAKHLKEIQLIDPTNGEQDKLVFLNQLLDQKINLMSEVSLARVARDNLLSKLISGQFRIQ
jgi:type I restriction enzyme, S subunit